jgi:putative ABC transport system substrate-binding protein
MHFYQWKRREFIKLVGGAAAGWPLAARAQQPILRVGTVSVLISRSAPGLWLQIEKGLRELGYVDGQNLAIEFINMEGHNESYPEAMRELVRRKVDIIIAYGPEAALTAAMFAAGTLPIVMIAIDYDPLALGYVASLARPTGNVTGLFLQQTEQSAKRVQLIKQALPQLQAATVLWDRFSADQWHAIRNAGETLGLRFAGVELRDQPYNYEEAMPQASPDHRDALIVTASPIFFPDRQRIAETALRHRIPSMYALREWVDAGGLVSFGVSFAAIGRRAAYYVDRIARGAKPVDLPIEQPTKFELVINLKTAKALGLNLSDNFLTLADEIIE